ncbi:hypothetical protein ERUR111494_08135 [Erysipelothrix urinaevulpis]|uniref:hypothetical protein n=1 Tax=Erysipelothrix urinaevulpis TaxID=2683717 RepID=UPI00135B8A92|nr:hypothetical protein [Erysipelothrix urinaevulpis]
MYHGFSPVSSICWIIYRCCKFTIPLQTDLGLNQLESEYGVKTEILSDDHINFYKGQILLLWEEVEDQNRFSEVITKQIEMRDTKAEENKKTY